MKLGARDELIEEVCGIVAHYQRAEAGHSVNGRIVYDADTIVSLEERENSASKGSEALAGEIETLLFTQTGKEVARALLLAGP